MGGDGEHSRWRLPCARRSGILGGRPGRSRTWGGDPRRMGGLSPGPWRAGWGGRGGYWVRAVVRHAFPFDTVEIRGPVASPQRSVKIPPGSGVRGPKRRASPGAGGPLAFLRTEGTSSTALAAFGTDGESQETGLLGHGNPRIRLPFQHRTRRGPHGGHGSRRQVLSYRYMPPSWPGFKPATWSHLLYAVQADGD